MTTSLLSILAIGFILGLKHAIEPDHVVAVSTVATRTGSFLKAAVAGVFWGIGHTVTLFIVGMLLLSLKIQAPENVMLGIELLVGVMIIYLGWTTIASYRKQKIHMHVHEHQEHKHVHFHSHEQQSHHRHSHLTKANLKSLLIGTVHGFAGSGALVLLTMGTTNSIGEAAMYILVFGGGTIIGMMVFALLMSMPFILLSKQSTKLNENIGILTGVISIAYGIFYMVEIALGSGWFV